MTRAVRGSHISSWVRGGSRAGGGVGEEQRNAVAVPTHDVGDRMTRAVRGPRIRSWAREASRTGGGAWGDLRPEGLRWAGPRQSRGERIQGSGGTLPSN